MRVPSTRDTLLDDGSMCVWEGVTRLGIGKGTPVIPTRSGTRAFDLAHTSKTLGVQPRRAVGSMTGRGGEGKQGVGQCRGGYFRHILPRPGGIRCAAVLTPATVAKKHPQSNTLGLLFFWRLGGG